MLEIIKYQLKGRKNSALFLLGVFALVNAITWIFAGTGLALGNANPPAATMFWTPVSIAITVITTVVTFFLCGSGHVNDLLWRNTSYLMLTIPRRGWEILGGRLIAGFIEFLAIALPALVMMSVHLAIWGAYANAVGSGFPGALALVYRHFFVTNLPATLFAFLFTLCVFVSAGISLTFAAIASRSFVRSRGIATAITIALFIFVSHRVSDFSMWLSTKLNWFVNIPLDYADLSLLFGAMGQHGIRGGVPNGIVSYPVPVAPFLCFLAIAAVLFAASAWLLERKVEL